MGDLAILTSTSFLLVFLTTRAMAVTYTVTNTATQTAGGSRFNNEIGSEYARQTLSSASDFIWKTFQQTNPADRKNIPQVRLTVETMKGKAYTSDDNQIHLSANYVQSYSGDVKTEVTGILYHQLTHVWQWEANGQAAKWLIEGIADFMRLKAGYASPQWVKPGQGDKWDQSSDVTARFLDYRDSLKGGFVAELNKKMKAKYSDAFFTDLLGKSINQLWGDYKANYNPN